jgi:argininosuccinate lyase
VKMWSGRFRQPLDPEFERWQRSFPFDQQLLMQELAASRAHARALCMAGVLTAAEFEQIASGLEWIGKNAASILDDEEAEDVHHFVEKQLTAKIGEVGLKLHTGRSRNEQIATDLRLYVRQACDDMQAAIATLVEAILEQAEAAGEAVMPSYTHMQRAEPVLVSHWLLAYCEMLLRDATRFADCRKRLNVCPLGSGAITGATLKLDRWEIAKELGFDAPTANSMDATSDRDFAIEFSQAASVLAVHLSRWAEEFILFATQEYGFITLPETYSTGSSAMPQKQNPDALELIRGKAARVIAASQNLLIAAKGLPLAYNKDLQETQEPVLDVAATLRGMLPVAAGFMRDVKFNREPMQRAAETGFMNAMAAATYLVGKGVPFRRAHEYVANAVRLCVERKCELGDLKLEELQGIAAQFENDFYPSVALKATLDCHDVYGGTATARVREAVTEMRSRVAAIAGAAHVYA